MIIGILKIILQQKCIVLDYLLCHACNAYSLIAYDGDVLNYEGEREKNYLMFNLSVFKDHRFWYLAKLERMAY